MTQYEKSAATLELPAILAMLARHAASDAAKERALAVAPSTDAATVKRLLAETSAALDAANAKADEAAAALRRIADWLENS